jgi:hypothetical protein
MSIYRTLIPVAALAALAFHSLNIVPGNREGQADENVSVIKAEVIGTLYFQEGRGYYISVKSDESSARENRVWLWISENKVLVRKLEGLTRKKVIAKGELEQMPWDVQASVPPHAMYLKNLEVESIKAK